MATSDQRHAGMDNEERMGESGFAQEEDMNQQEYGMNRQETESGEEAAS